MNNGVWCVRCAYTGFTEPSPSSSISKLCPRCSSDLKSNGAKPPKAKLRPRKPTRVADTAIEDDPDVNFDTTDLSKTCHSCRHRSEHDVAKGFAYCSIIDMPSPAAYQCDLWASGASAGSLRRLVATDQGTSQPSRAFSHQPTDRAAVRQRMHEMDRSVCIRQSVAMPLAAEKDDFQTAHGPLLSLRDVSMAVSPTVGERSPQQ